MTEKAKKENLTCGYYIPKKFAYKVADRLIEHAEELPDTDMLTSFGNGFMAALTALSMKPDCELHGMDIVEFFDSAYRVNLNHLIDRKVAECVDEVKFKQEDYGPDGPVGTDGFDAGGHYWAQYVGIGYDPDESNG